MFYPTDASSETDKANRHSALLGLCPLLVMTTSVVDALSLAIAAFVALVTTGILVVLIRQWIPEAVRLPALMLAIGLCTSTIMLLLHAFAFDLYQRIAFMVPIVITNWFVLVGLDRAPQGGVFSGLANTVSAAAALVIIGAVCEAIGHGTLLSAIDVLPAMGDLQITFADSGFLLAATPSGVFIIAGLLLAARNATRQRT